MKIDFYKPLLDLSGEPMKSGDKDFLLVNACQEALTATFPDEMNLSGADKVKRFSLALKVGEKLPQELTIDEVAEIRRLVAKAYGPLVVGRAYEMLDEKRD